MCDKKRNPAKSFNFGNANGYNLPDNYVSVSTDIQPVKVNGDIVVNFRNTKTEDCDHFLQEMKKEGSSMEGKSGFRDNVTKEDLKKYCCKMIELRPRLEHVESDMIDFVVDMIYSTVIGKAGYSSTLEAAVERMSIEFGNYQYKHHHYGSLAARICMKVLYRKTKESFHAMASALRMDNKLNDATWAVICEHKEEIQRIVTDYAHYDFSVYTFQGIKHLQKSYLMKNNKGEIEERLVYMNMRISLGLWPNDFNRAIETFKLLINGTISHGSPTMFNAGKPNQQLASCFIQTADGSSAVKRAKSLLEAASISAMNGGIGINIDGSDTNQFAVVLDRLIKDVPQGGKDANRPGAGALYREPWESDFMNILARKRPEGGQLDEKHRDLFIGTWMPDLFMKKLKQSVTGNCPLDWYFFYGKCDERLRNLYGPEFKNLCEHFVEKRLYVDKMQIFDVMNAMCTTFKETGVPYTIFKDTANRRSNHNNRGVLRGSNLCAEILEYSNVNETAVCTLGSIRVSEFAQCFKDVIVYDWDGLKHATKVLVRNLNQTIDLNTYPSDKAKLSNKTMRPIGIGMRNVQGMLFKLKLPFMSAMSKMLQEKIMETIYYAALEESNRIAVDKGESYKYFNGSMYSRGIAQQFTSTCFVGPVECDFCEPKLPVSGDKDVKCNYCQMVVHGWFPAYNWTKLIDLIKRDGLYNSLVTALMPTVGTSQIFGDYEAFDPVTSLLYVSKVDSGDYQIVCRELVDELVKLKMWTPKMIDTISEKGGTLEGIFRLPNWIKDVFKTVWEIPQKARIRLMSHVSRYVDQSVSFNIYLRDPSNAKYITLLIYAHEHDLKTGDYYQRSQSAVDARKVVKAGDCVKEIVELNSIINCKSCTV